MSTRESQPPQDIIALYNMAAYLKDQAGNVGLNFAAYLAELVMLELANSAQKKGVAGLSPTRPAALS